MRYGIGTLGFPVYSSMEYSPIAQRVLLSSKESGLALADSLVFESTKYSLNFFLREVGIGALVPIPSRLSASRKRGRKVISDLADRLCESFVDLDPRLTSEDILVHTRAVRDQSLLSHGAREHNLRGALAVRPGLDKTPMRSVILIDDLVTSGATLQESARALRISGFDVLGAVTACVSQPLR